MEEQTFEDQTLVCGNCGQEFVWTAGEQEFYSKKGFQAPQRCKDCRQKKKDERLENRQMTKITCSDCGKEDEVPFVPTEGREVLCRDCFGKKKQGETKAE